MESKRITLYFAVLSVALGCGGGDDEILVPETIRIIPSSNNQSAPVTAFLNLPLAVEVLTSDGRPAVRAGVQWVSSVPGGSVADRVSVVGGDGLAIMSYRAATNPGDFMITATLVSRGDRSANFNTRAIARAVVTEVVPPGFGGGDTVVLRGSSMALVDAVEFGSARVSVLITTQTTVSVVAPVCMDPGVIQLVPVQQGVKSAAFSAEYLAGDGIGGLVPGQYVSISSVDVVTCATFPAAGSQGAEYLMVVQSVTGNPGITASYRLSGDTLAPSGAIVLADPVGLALRDRFHDRLREREAEIARMPKPDGVGIADLPQRVVGVGDDRTFMVCSRIGCSDSDDFQQVDAEARFVGDQTILYLDKQAPAGGFADSDFETFGRLIDDRLYVVASVAFGAESDVDGNGRVAILFTPVVNGLTPAAECSNSIFVGFFFGIDIDRAFANDARSNKGEVFYAMTPDPSGSAGCSVSLASVRSLVPVTLVHELQHMISYNQHVLLRGGEKEVLWLDEALSHVAEELAARDFLAGGDEGRFSQFATGNLTNLYQYLRSPTAFSPVAIEGTGSLEERGAGWWLLRWVLDHFGNGSPRALVETSLSGNENIESFAGESIENILIDWAIATYVSDLPGFDAPDRLSFDFWRLRAVFQGFHDRSPSRFPLPFPIVPPEFGSGFGQVTGAVRSGSGDYFQLLQQPMGPGFGIVLTNGSGGATQAAANVRLNILRIR